MPANENKSDVYPTEPEVFDYRGVEYLLWQNDPNWWVANVSVGGEFHGATRQGVESLAREQIDDVMDQDNSE
ncbi:MAG TPA: hypothetical protein VGN72_01170 [Tepidisphaeraceae bacterium]|jgi:hypothetical protein|nr:hypothetical protein [Tepidisphaeraceae bacterium]